MNYFRAGGKLEANFPSYLTRDADDILIESLIKREYTYILSSRQMGKTSLIYNTIYKIQKLISVDVVYIDLSTNSIATEIQFYANILTIIYDKFDLEFEFYKYQNKLKINPPHIIFLEYLIDLPFNTDSGLIIFFDEIDSLYRDHVNKALTINLFSTIRSLYNLRGDTPKLNNLTFCLSGVLPPIKLLSDPHSTPFNIGVHIRLGYIEQDKFSSYEKGLAEFKGNKTNLINSIFHWSNGHPYLTQYLCKVINQYDDEIMKDTDKFVYKIVCDLLTDTDNNIETNTHFPVIQNYIMHDKKLRKKALELYNRVWKGEKIYDNSTIEVQELLKTSGLIQSHNGILIISNNIYHKYFNDLWVERMLRSIYCPFSDPLLLWLKGEKKYSDANLTGNSLKTANTWANNSDDLSQNEMEFLHQCRKNEIFRKKKRNLTIITALVLILACTMVILFILNVNYNHTKTALEEKNITQINDNISYLRLIQDVKTNPKKLFATINQYRRKYKEHDELQIEYFKSLIEKTPYEISDVRSNMTNVEILSENKFIYSTTYNIIFSQNSILNPLIRTNDTIKCFNYNEKTGIGAVIDNKNTLYLLHPTQYLIKNNFPESINHINVFIDKMLLASESNVYILNKKGDISKKIKLNSTIIKCFSGDNRTYILCSDNVIYKYTPDLDSIIPIFKNIHPQNGIIYINPQSNYYASENNTSISYFNFNKPNEEHTISFLNRIKDFNICGSMLVVICYDGNFYFHNLETNNEFVLKSANLLDNIINFKFNSDKTFIVFTKIGSVLKYNLSLLDFRKRNIQMTEISAVYKNEDFEIIGNFHNKLTLTTQNNDYNLTGNLGGITAIDISEKFKIIATSSFDHSIRLWDFEGNKKDSIIMNNGGVLDLKFINGQQKLLAACKNSKIYLWNLKSNKYKSFKGHTKMVEVIDVSDESDIFISGSRDSTIIIWNYNKEDSFIKKLKYHNGWITDIEISPDSKHFLSSSTDGSIILWDIDGKYIEKYIGHGTEVWDICWISNNSFISNSRDNIFCIWDINGDIKKLFTGNASHNTKILYNNKKNKLHLYFLNGEIREYQF